MSILIILKDLTDNYAILHISLSSWIKYRNPMTRKMYDSVGRNNTRDSNERMTQAALECD